MFIDIQRPYIQWKEQKYNIFCQASGIHINMSDLSEDSNMYLYMYTWIP